MVEPLLERVPLAQIEVKPQVRQRIDPAGIDELAGSIRSVGLQQPLLCRQDAGKLTLIDGERRWRACSKLGWTSVPVIVLGEDMQPAEVVTRQLVANLQRSDLNPRDKAEGIRSLMQHGGLTAEQAAKRLSVSSSAVTKALAIVRLPEELQTKVASGELAADAAYQLSRVEGDEQAALAEQVLSGQMNRDDLARRVRKKAARTSQTPGRRISLMAGENRSLTLAGQGWGRDLTLSELIEALEQLATRGKKAAKQGLTLSTFARTLKDQAST